METARYLIETFGFFLNVIAVADTLLKVWYYVIVEFKSTDIKLAYLAILVLRPCVMLALAMHATCQVSASYSVSKRILALEGAEEV